MEYKSSIEGNAMSVGIQPTAAVAFVRERLTALSEPGYRDFTAGLLPTVERERILGVRSPALRALAKELRGRPEAAAFLRELPHRYHEEKLLHAYLLAYEKDFARCLASVEAFLPEIDNWAVCDCLSLPCFRRHRPELLARIPVWLRSGRVYTLRFGIKQLMDHFLEEDFFPACLELAGSVRSEEYYVNMMQAWYFATALAKQWDAALPWLAERRLAQWVHNKTIQKAVESERISEAQKAYLRSLRLR